MTVTVSVAAAPVPLCPTSDEILREQAERRRFASGAEVLAYGRARIEEGDEEWIGACDKRCKWKKVLRSSSTKPA